MTRQEAFLTRLRRHRERSRVSLDEIANFTRVRRDLLEGFEQGDLSAWPKGLYARAWVRGYAEYVGLDPDEAVEEFCRLFPHGDRRTQSTMNELASILDVPAPFLDEEAIQSATYGRRATDRAVPPPPLSLRDRMARAAHVLGTVRGTRDVAARLAESWRILRPSRRIL